MTNTKPRGRTGTYRQFPRLFEDPYFESGGNREGKEDSDGGPFPDETLVVVRRSHVPNIC